MKALRLSEGERIQPRTETPYTLSMAFQTRGQRAVAKRLAETATELLAALRDLRESVTDAYKTGRIPAEPFVRAGNVIAKAEGKVTARFRVSGRLDTGRMQEGTVTINRQNGVIAVRPLHRRREYALPLSLVAELIVAKVVKAELAARKG